MARIIKRIPRKSRSLPPGALIYTGAHDSHAITVRLIDYDAERIEERDVKDVAELKDRAGKGGVAWIDVDGVHDAGLIGKIGEAFGLHPLLLEDVLSAGQRPKLEEFEEHLFVVLKSLTLDEKTLLVSSENVGVVFSKNFLISFQERPGDVFGGVRERLRKAKGRIRKAGADYLAYALIDAVVDSYFSIAAALGERIEGLEEEALAASSQQTLLEIMRLRREILHLRKAVWPLREAIGRLQKGEHEMVADETHPYIKDLYDHTIQIVEAVDSYREMLSGLTELYLSGISSRMNEIMKTLTVFAAIFIPLTFLAGIYGMNFEFMPELKLRWGYPMFWAAVLLVGGGLAAYFKRKGWL
ncbi:MAG: magnesium/cobalt transporter CorA [Elusimicrobiota bacterium]